MLSFYSDRDDAIDLFLVPREIWNVLEFDIIFCIYDFAEWWKQPKRTALFRDTSKVEWIRVEKNYSAEIFSQFL